MEKIKSTDPSQLPPCKAVLVEKVRRANYISLIWKSSTVKDIDVGDPVENGWSLENNTYVINWFDGRQVPEDVTNCISQEFDQTEEDDITYNYSSDKSSSDA